MRLHAPLLCPNLVDVPARARALEASGVDGVFSFEGPHEPFMPLVLAAEHSELLLSTGVAIAFARTPMTVSNIAFDLQQMSGGRLTLGLGSQVRAHIEARYSMPWGKPVSRMREFVAAYHAIFDAWLEGTKLDFRGEFYTHRLMPPMFVPLARGETLAGGRPPVVLAGVGPKMVACAAEVGDGHAVHPFHSAASLREITQKALDVGFAKRTTDRSFRLLAQALVITGSDAKERATVEAAVRAQIAFYGSTPAYRGVLEVEGRGAVADRLHALSKKGGWAEMSAEVDDELLHAIAIVGDPEAAGKALAERYRGVADDVALATPLPLSDDALHRVATAFARARDQATLDS